MFVVVEDENGMAVAPVLKVLAHASGAREIYFVGPAGEMRRVGRSEVPGAIAALARASMESAIAIARAGREIKRLELAPRSTPSFPTGHRLLYLNANLWFGIKAGGSVGHVSGVVNGFLEEGYTVVFASAGGRLMSRAEADYRRLLPPRHFGLPWERNTYRFHFDVVDQLDKVVNEGPLDFIYQRMSIGNYSGVVLSRKWNVPLVLEYNGSEVWAAKNWGRPLQEHDRGQRVENVCIRHAHLVVTVSDVLRDELVERGVPVNRIVSYPNCIDPSMFDPARFSRKDVGALRARHQVGGDALVVTFIGTFGQWHGIDVLARAIRRLVDERPAWLAAHKIHFLLVGDGIKGAEVRTILGEHAGGPFITLVGLVPQHEAPLYLAASDIVSSPHVANADGSRFFGSPTKLFEYMAMGKPIVASDLDQIGSVLAGGIVAAELVGLSPRLPHDAPAVLCRPGAVEDQIDGIRFLVENPEWRARLGENARSRALSRYTWRHHVQAILQGIEALR
jgi:glycosyltransferase involved in cell wall biosynthesis